MDHIKVGQAQSPIDLPSMNKIEESDFPKIKINPSENAEGEFVEDGHSYKFNSKSLNKLELKLSVSETLLFDSPQFHFHTPSEHTFEGKFYPLEMHLVHLLKPSHSNKSPINIAVFGFLFDLGYEENMFLNEVIKGKKKSLIHLKSFFKSMSNLHYIAYPGSLTTPPLSEGVQWIVFPNPIKATLDQIVSIHNHWKKHLGTTENNRLIQPLNGRKITKHLEDIWN